MVVNVDIKKDELLKEKEELLVKLDSCIESEYELILNRILDIDFDLNLFSNKE